MASNKRRKALGSDPLEGAAGTGDAPTGSTPEAAPSAPPPAEEPTASEEPAAAAEEPAAAADAPVDANVPPAPDLRPVPPRGAMIPNDRLRALAVVLLLVLFAAVWAEQANKLDEITEALTAAEGALEEYEVGQESARVRADKLQRILARTEAANEQMELELKEYEVSSAMLEHALAEFSRASAGRDQRGRLVYALDLVRSDLGVALRWPVAERPRVLEALDSGDTQRLGRAARPEELAALRGELPIPTVTALAEASDGFRPWRRLVDDGRLEPHASSPERGILLVTLLDAGVAPASLVSIPWQGADLAGLSLGAADLRGLDLPGADLRGTDLSRARLEEVNLQGALYDAATKWPGGFDVDRSGAITEPVDAAQ